MMVMVINHTDIDVTSLAAVLAPGGIYNWIKGK